MQPAATDTKTPDVGATQTHATASEAHATAPKAHATASKVHPTSAKMHSPAAAAEVSASSSATEMSAASAASTSGVHGQGRGECHDRGQYDCANCNSALLHGYLPRRHVNATLLGLGLSARLTNTQHSRPTRLGRLPAPYPPRAGRPGNWFGCPSRGQIAYHLKSQNRGELCGNHGGFADAPL